MSWLLKDAGSAQAYAGVVFVSAYDASYLELSLPAALPLATLGRELRRAADNTGVKLVKSG